MDSNFINIVKIDYSTMLVCASCLIPHEQLKFSTTLRDHFEFIILLAYVVVTVKNISSSSSA